MRIGRRAGRPEPSDPEIPGRFETSVPSVQTALDVFQGEWTTELPGEFARHKAGEIPLFQDTRISWLLERMGSIEGMKVLELGPMEGGHTYMLDRAGAERVVAIEANRRAFLKCLIVKEVLGLPKCEFLCGDFVEYLRQSDEQFDLIVASGVLYHMTEPVELLHLAATRTDNLFLWTHFHDRERIDRDPDVARFFVSSRESEHAGFSHELHRFQYVDKKWGGFCGGTAVHSHWMTKAGILEALGHFGLDRIETAHEDPNHPHGPCFSLLARRESKTGPPLTNRPPIGLQSP